MNKFCTFLFVVFGVFVSKAQVAPVVQDSVQTGFTTGKIEVKDPQSILKLYTYDPVTGMYVYSKTVNGFPTNYPAILSPKEYEDLVRKDEMRNYFKKKLDAIDGKKDGSDVAKRDLLPRYYVRSGLFESIFGSNTIDVKPTGTVEMDLGLRYTKQDNPAFSPRNRVTTSFNFNQRISMSLMGKVGTRLSVNVNYDTQSTFAFQNLIKLEYTPTEDDIIQKIEVGNVSMPLNTSLIKGPQSLFGVKTKLQFGKTSITGVFSEQKSQTKTVMAQGGGTVQDFDIYALNYDSNRHFFLSQYFRSKYDSALKNYPFVDSRVQITRLEVWVTNKQNRVNTTTGNNLRNIIALHDLGEAQLTGLQDSEIVVLNPPTGMFNNPVDSPADNSNNDYDPKQIAAGTGLLNNNVREIATSDSGFNANVSEGADYSKLENARKLAATEYTFNPQLGYVSLQQALANDEVLAVAYQYTIGDAVYQVGEFANDGVASTVVTNTTPGSETVETQSLILKMLKSNLTNVNYPIWNLMMKNIYQIPGAYQLKQDNFKFNILYTDPSAVNYIAPVSGSSFPPNPAVGNEVENTPLLRVFNLDRLNNNNDPQTGGDGFFDFMQGLTIDTQNGRIIFTTKEPFGELLFSKLSTGAGENYKDINTYNPNQLKYVFRNMYANTQSGALQDSDKNKFLLRGKYTSSGADGIPIGAFNVPRGSVQVTAGGRVLVEGIDYSVNYQLGRVQILDPSLQASNTPISVSLENNSVFGQQTKHFYGIYAEHKISDKFLIGGTFLKLTEKPITQKSSFGQESVNNNIFGLNTNYATELPFFTRLANKLPNVDTDVPSNLSVRGEVAFLKPQKPKLDSFNGEATIYVDDFEGSQSTIDMRSPYAWSLASTPTTLGALTPPSYNFNATATDLTYGYKRAKLAWYTIDPIFYTQRPAGVSNDDLSLNSTRRVYSQELYPLTDIAAGQSQVVNTLDLSYFPTERGPYNNSNNVAASPTENFGGIVRAINSTNFQQGNVEYIQFWVMDPYVGTGKTPVNNTGKVYFNLGEISEDVLKDGRKQYENGLGPNQLVVNPQPLWGDVPASQSLVYAFDVDPNNRQNQDVGLDGLPNAREGAIYNNFASEPDPAGDDYSYYLNASGGVLDRYKNYNGVDGNSAVDVSSANRGSSTLPDVEDVNKDNTMNTINAYYEYSIDMKPAMKVGENYITDIRDTQVTLENGLVSDARWIQFKIPILQPQNTIGSISDFTSIRFMRMFVTNFSNELTLRFGSLDLVRGDWRTYTQTLDPKDTNLTDDNTTIDVLAVNVLENSDRCPVNYIVPPGVRQEQLYSNNTVINQNEQALSLRISGTGNGGLEPQDSRAVFKAVSVDMRQFKKLRMFLHAESLPNEALLKDGQMTGFIRFGNDFTDNFYQVELALKVTTPPANCSGLTAEQVWPTENDIELSLSTLTAMKIRTSKISLDPGVVYYPDDHLDVFPDGDGDSKLRLGIRGNPNFGLVRELMLGVKNNGIAVNSPSLKGEVWFNELRVSDMDDTGGMAAVLNVDTNFADFATVSGTGRMSTVGFGALEQGPNDRSRENNKQYNIVTNLSLGKLFPPKWKLNLPFNYAIGEQVVTPEYDPLNPDIKLQELLDNTDDANEKKRITNRSVEYTRRKSINFIGVRKERADDQKQHVYDPENFTFSQSFNEVKQHNFQIEDYVDQQANTMMDYAFGFQPKSVEPFKNKQFVKKSSYWKMLSDFNFNYLPSNLNFNTNIIRQYNRQQYRQVDDVQGIGIDPLYKRNFGFNYQYGFNYNLTKSLKLNYKAMSSNLVKSYMGANNIPIDSFTIWDNYFDSGTPNQHTQQFILNYQIPIDKIPVFSFIKANYTYTGDYSWQRASLALSNIVIDGTNYDLGNTLQNAATNNLNAAFTMDVFYKYIGLVKKSQLKTNPKAVAPKPGEKIANTNVLVPRENNFLNGLIGVLTSIKNIQSSYIVNKGTVLPGYTPGIGFFGSSKPTLGFVFGNQDDVRYEAAKNGWLTTYQAFNQNYTQVESKIFKTTANLDLFPDFKVDLTLDKAYSVNSSEQYDVSASGQYNSRSPYSFGTYSISTILINTSFSTSDESTSAAFDNFRSNRLTIANRLATARGIDITNPVNIDASGYPIGYGKNNQAVLLPAFLAAYSGGNASSASLGIFKSFPLPNWVIKYNGLMRYAFFKKNFKRFSLQNAYRASYTVNAFRSNLDYDNNPNGVDASGNFLNKTVMSNVNLVEQFNPLIRVDFELMNSLKVLTEIKKDRSLSMSFDNSLLTEVRGMEYVTGLGYRIKNVQFSSRLADSPTGIIKSDIILKADLSYRNNKTIVRYLDYDNNQLAGGQSVWSLKLTGDYSLSKNLTIVFFYNHAFSKAVISTSFPLTNITSGFTFRYTFGN